MASNGLRDGEATPEEVAAGERSLAEAEARQEEWELAEFVGFLRAVRDGGELPWPAHEVALMYMTLGSHDAHGALVLTEAGTALLALLEVEACKRRIGAAGWCWGARGPLADGVHLHHPVTHGHGLFERDEYGDGYWTAAAEYAEAHAQGGGTDGA